MKKIILILLCALLYDCNSRNGLPEDVICTCYIFPTSGTYGYYIEINSSGKITTLLEPSLGTNVLDLIQEDEYIDPMGDNLLDSVVLKKSLVLDSHDIKELKTVIDRIAKVGNYNPFVESSWNDHVGMVAFVNNHRYPYVPGEEKCKWHKWKWKKEEGKMPLSELFTFLTNKSPVPIKWGQGQDIPEVYKRIGSE